MKLALAATLMRLCSIDSVDVPSYEVREMLTCPLVAAIATVTLGYKRYLIAYAPEYLNT